MSKKTEHEHYTEAYPKYRVDINNPKNSLGGSDVVTHYAWTEEDDKFILSYSEDGKVKIHADKDLEIVTGASKQGNGVDILIHSGAGDVVINADKNGEVKIFAKKVTVKADESMELKGGDKITMEANDIEFRGTSIRGNQIWGNMAPIKGKFGALVLAKSHLGIDYIKVKMGW